MSEVSNQAGSLSEAYQAFLRSKVKMAKSYGVTVEASEISERLKPHQRAMVKWLVEGGRRACFAAFGLGTELSARYFCDAAHYCKAASEQMAMPELFDIATQ